MERKKVGITVPNTILKLIKEDVSLQFHKQRYSRLHAIIMLSGRSCCYKLIRMSVLLYFEKEDIIRYPNNALSYFLL